MLCPGGTEHSGGIGRWARYMLAEWQSKALRPHLEIVDTRGYGGTATAFVAFTRALLRLGRLRLCGQLRLIHMNISIRGSAVRKCIIGLLARLTGVKFVLHIHTGEMFTFYARLPSPAQWALRRLFAAAELVLTLGSETREQVIRQLGVPPSRVGVLCNAVPIPERLAREAPPDGVCHIVMLGRLGERKGLPQLLDALSSDAMRARPWRATLAGDGAVETTRDTLRREGLDGRVVCPGWLDAESVARLLREADILVLPSLAEGLPVAILEALAYCIAVVATPVGSTPELLRDGESALLVPPGDAGALAAALASLIDDPAKRARIAAAGHAVCAAKLDVFIAARTLEAMYRDILAPAAVQRQPAPYPQPHSGPQA